MIDSNAAQLPLVAQDRPIFLEGVNRRAYISRDEMNLAEFPLTVLSTRSNPKIKTLEFSDTIRGKNGELLDRKWIITGADKFGLPTSSDDEILLGLLKLTVENGFRDRKVYFTRYELLRILRWTTEGRSYSRLQKALDRLSGVRIKATNAFYDNETKSHSTRNFGIIDAYEINDGRSTDPKPSFFTWSEVLFKSFQVGFIKKLDLDFYLGLKSAVSKRLYRYLDKHFWYKSKVQVNLFTLAHDKVGISRTYQYASSIRQQLDPAFEELIERGFVAKCEYLGRGHDSEVVIYAESGKPRALGSKSARTDKAPVREKTNVDADDSGQGRGLFEHFSAGQSELEPERRSLIGQLVERGLKEAQVLRLVANKDPGQISHMREIVRYFDRLQSTGSRLVNRSPIGFLYRAIEKSETFVLPNENQAGVGGTAKNPSRSGSAASRVGTVSRAGAVRATAKSGPDLQTEFLIERKRELQKLRQGVEPEILSNLEKEVERALERIRGTIRESSFKQTVDHGVNERLAKLFALPEFEEWLTLRRG